MADNQPTTLTDVSTASPALYIALSEALSFLRSSSDEVLENLFYFDGTLNKEAFDAAKQAGQDPTAETDNADDLAYLTGVNDLISPVISADGTVRRNPTIFDRPGNVTNSADWVKAVESIMYSCSQTSRPDDPIPKFWVIHEGSGRCSMFHRDINHNTERARLDMFWIRIIQTSQHEKGLIAIDLAEPSGTRRWKVVDNDSSLYRTV